MDFLFGLLRRILKTLLSLLVRLLMLALLAALVINICQSAGINIQDYVVIPESLRPLLEELRGAAEWIVSMLRRFIELA